MHQTFVLFTSLFISNYAEYSLEVLPAHTRAVPLDHIWLLKSTGKGLGVLEPLWEEQPSLDDTKVKVKAGQGHEGSDQD